MSTVPPGPPGHLLVGNLPEFGRDILGFFTRCAAYGPVARIRLGPWEALFLSEPELIEHVLLTNHRNYVKHSFFWRHVEEVFGSGLLTAEGDRWLRQRRLIQPAFHRDRIAGYGAVMVEHTERMLEGWREDEVYDVHAEMMGLTLRIVAKVLFDTDVVADAERLGVVFEGALREVARRFRRPFPIPGWLPLPGNLRYRRAVGTLDRLVYGMIDEAESRGPGGEDLLSMLLAARDESGTGMSRRQIRDECVTLLLAGHETTAIALSWTWLLLARHSAVADRLRAELDGVLGGRRPAMDDLESLPYARWVVMESMRLYPPAYALGREAVDEDVIGGCPVEPGTTVFISPWVLHRRQRFFEEPGRFRPERWADGLERRLPRFAYMPFGGGPRICVGSHFAMVEATLILATIARRYRLELAGPEPALFPTVTLRPDGELPMRPVARAAALAS